VPGKDFRFRVSTDHKECFLDVGDGLINSSGRVNTYYLILECPKVPTANGLFVESDEIIPESVLVVIHTPARDVLLIERADKPGYWQSVTGSKDRIDEPLADTCVREVAEETGIRLVADPLPGVMGSLPPPARPL
jgi:hypothetical protein